MLRVDWGCSVPSFVSVRPKAKRKRRGGATAIEDSPKLGGGFEDHFGPLWMETLDNIWLNISKYMMWLQGSAKEALGLNEVSHAGFLRDFTRSLLPAPPPTRKNENGKKKKRRSVHSNVNPGLINHGLLIRGYSSNSHNMILKWYPPIKQPRGLLIQGWHYYTVHSDRVGQREEAQFHGSFGWSLSRRRNERRKKQRRRPTIRFDREWRAAWCRYMMNYDDIWLHMIICRSCGKQTNLLKSFYGKDWQGDFRWSQVIPPFFGCLSHVPS